MSGTQSALDAALLRWEETDSYASLRAYNKAAEDLRKETWNIEHQMEDLKIVRTYVRTYVRLRDIIAKLVWPITRAD